MINMIHVIGEILVDIFDDGTTKKAFPGGAPFNVASNLAKFGSIVNFYGAIGKDEYGKMLNSFARKQKFNHLELIKYKDKPTTQAIVTLNNGERSFHFERNDAADYQLKFSKLKKLNIQKEDVVHIGSLMLSDDKARKFFYKSIKYIKGLGAKISFDVNYREDIFKDTKTAQKIFKKAIKVADYLKISNDELDILSSKKIIESQIKSLTLPNQYVFVSLGKQGSLVYKDGIICKVPTVEIKPIDTTGAGDAFYSYVLYELDKKNNDFEYILKRANQVGAFATQKLGAINVVPNINEID